MEPVIETFMNRILKLFIYNDDNIQETTYHLTVQQFSNQLNKQIIKIFF